MYQRDQGVHGCGRGRRHGYVHRHVSGCVLLQVRAYVRGGVLLRMKDC